VAGRPLPQCNTHWQAATRFGFHYSSQRFFGRTAAIAQAFSLSIAVCAESNVDINKSSSSFVSSIVT
jgi:hypothetical protein